MAWVRKTIGHMPGVHVNDFSDFYTQLAIQGPRAAGVAVRRIGTAAKGTSDLVVRDEAGLPLVFSRSRFQHFA